MGATGPLATGTLAAQTEPPATGAPAGSAVDAGQAAPNPYRLAPFHADFPVPLEYPPRIGLDYDRTRRQILERLASNLQGNVRRDAWLTATEFYWRAPEDAVQPLIEAMDRAFGNPALGDADVVKNCVEAMGRMGNTAFDVPLRRALQHKNPQVQQAAFAALATCGKPETLRELSAAFDSMDGRARTAWLRGVRLRLGNDAVPMLKAVVMGKYPVGIRDEALKEALQLPAPAAAEVLRGRWEDAVGEFKAIIAGVLHAVGDTTGTVWLRETMAGEDLPLVQAAVRHSAFGDIGVLRDSVLALSAHLRPEVRLEVASVLRKVPGDDVADVYEVLLAPEEPWDIRAIALRELMRRGRTRLVDVLLEELKTATATRLVSVVNQLSASGDPRAVPVLVERFEEAKPGQGRPFLQGLAQNASDAAASALFAIFRGPERVVGKGGRGDLTTRNYVPTLLLNLRGSESVLLREFTALPADQWALRAPMLPTLVGIASDRTEQGLQEACVAPVRAILFDRNELPQMRVLALNQLGRRWLRFEDVLKLKNTHQDEAPGLRALFADYLNEHY